MQEVKFEESWNKKRILIALLAIVFLGSSVYIFKGNLFPQNKKLASKPSSGSKESTASSNSEPNIQNVLGSQIESIKKEAGNLNIGEIASSSSQVQKILNEIRNLQNLPGNQLKDACLKICNGL